MFFTRGHPIIRALIGAVLLIAGILLHGLVLIAAGVVVVGWGLLEALAGWRGGGMIGGKGSGGAL